MGTSNTMYTKINTIDNLDVATSLDGTDPEKYIALVDGTGMHTKKMDLSLDHMVRMYINKSTTKNGGV